MISSRFGSHHHKAAAIAQQQAERDKKINFLHTIREKDSELRRLAERNNKLNYGITTSRFQKSPRESELLKMTHHHHGFREEKKAESYFIPSLVELCAKAIADNFERNPSFGNLSEEMVQMVTKRMSVDLPLQLTVPLVHDDDYWKRCCFKRWSAGKLGTIVITGPGATKVSPKSHQQHKQLTAAQKLAQQQSSSANVDDDSSSLSSYYSINNDMDTDYTHNAEVHADSWKQVYLERNLQDFLENIPSKESMIACIERVIQQQVAAAAAASASGLKNSQSMKTMMGNTNALTSSTTTPASNGRSNTNNTSTSSMANALKSTFGADSHSPLSLTGADGDDGANNELVNDTGKEHPRYENLHSHMDNILASVLWRPDNPRAGAFSAPATNMAVLDPSFLGRSEDVYYYNYINRYNKNSTVDQSSHNTAFSNIEKMRSKFVAEQKLKEEKMKEAEAEKQVVVTFPEQIAKIGNALKELQPVHSVHMLNFSATNNNSKPATKPAYTQKEETAEEQEDLNAEADNNSTAVDLNTTTVSTASNSATPAGTTVTGTTTTGESTVDIEAEVAKTLQLVDEMTRERLIQLCELCRDYIRSLRISSLMAHIDLKLIFELLPNLEQFSLTYGVFNAGMSFEFDMFGIKRFDCKTLASCLQFTTSLTTLRLTENLIDDEMVQGVLAGLVKNKSITTLDLSHNRIADIGAKSLAAYIQRNMRLTELNLCDNLIHAEGGRQLSRAISVNACLKILNLRLNRLGDEGGRHIAQGLLANKTLKVVNLSNNELGEESAKALGAVLKTNTALRSLDISGNALGEEGGKSIAEGLSSNKTIRTVDVRMSQVRENECEQIRAHLARFHIYGSASDEK